MPILRFGLLSFCLLLGACHSTPAAQPSSTTADNKLPTTQQASPKAPAQHAKETPQTDTSKPTPTSVDHSVVTQTSSSASKPTAKPADNQPDHSENADLKSKAPSTPNPQPPKSNANANANAKPASQQQPPNKAKDSKLAQHRLTMNHKLYPLTAKFKISVSKIPMPVSATLKLRRTNQPDTWKIQFIINSFLVDNLEESTFRWNNCHPKSIHYHHEFSGFGHHRFYDTNFSWHPPMAKTKSKSDTKTFPIPAHSVDDLTLLLQASCVFKEGYKDYYTTSIYGDDIRDNHFKLLRHETLKTRVGKLDTLVIEKMRDDNSERHTLFWIAPELNYMLVKAKHIESPMLFGEVTISRYSGTRLPVK